MRWMPLALSVVLASLALARLFGRLAVGLPKSLAATTPDTESIDSAAGSTQHQGIEAKAARKLVPSAEVSIFINGLQLYSRLKTQESLRCYVRSNVAGGSNILQ